MGRKKNTLVGAASRPTQQLLLRLSRLVQLSQHRKGVDTAASARIGTPFSCMHYDVCFFFVAMLWDATGEIPGFCSTTVPQVPPKTVNRSRVSVGR